MAKRLIWVDSLKGWLMVLVILGHAIQVVMGEDCKTDHVWNLIYSFHMPAFMAVSGWLAFRTFKTGGKNFIRRCNQLLIPFFAWGIISIAKGCTFTADKFIELILYPDKYFWFLWVLFWISVIFTFFQWIADKYNIGEMYTLLFGCGFLMVVMVVFEYRLLGFQFLAYYFLFYTLGFFIHRYERLQITNTYVFCAMTVVWGGLAWSWNMHELPSWMPAIPHVPSSLLQYAYRGFTAFIAIFILLGIAPNVLDVESKLNKCVSQLGVISLGLYVVHLSLMEYIGKWIVTLFPDNITAEIILAFIIGFICSYVIVKLLTLNKWTARILLGKV